MEEKINVAEILKDKPKGTKLYSDICCGECVLNEVSENAIYVDMYNKERFWYFSVYGTIYAFPNGGVLLYPSKEMRDWSKFSWKKGDVLVNKDESVHIIFEKFEDDAYKNFHGQYYLWEEGGSMVSFEEDENYMQTSDFNKANKEDAQEYIYKIEKILGGKLNRETLEIEKAQPEFKDGDVVVVDEIPFDLYSKCIFILKENLNTGEIKARAYVLYNVNKDSIFFDTPIMKVIERNIHLATDEEKQQLFDALAKEGKTWDAVKKQIIDLKPKWTPKPFDRVITRVDDDAIWTANIFSHIDQHGEYVTIGCVGGYPYCIPYNEETAHLLGTTDEWKGGEK